MSPEALDNYMSIEILDFMLSFRYHPSCAHVEKAGCSERPPSPAFFLSTLKCSQSARRGGMPLAPFGEPAGRIHLERSDGH